MRATDPPKEYFTPLSGTLEKVWRIQDHRTAVIPFLHPDSKDYTGKVLYYLYTVLHNTVLYRKIAPRTGCPPKCLTGLCNNGKGLHSTEPGSTEFDRDVFPLLPWQRHRSHTVLPSSVLVLAPQWCWILHIPYIRGLPNTVCTNPFWHDRMHDTLRKLLSASRSCLPHLSS